MSSFVNGRRAPVIILHLGSLRVGPRFDVAGFVGHVKAAVDKCGVERCDYVAICGDLTEGGRREDFARLEEVLSDLVAAVVRPPGDRALALERVMVVPGPADLALGDGAFTAFSEEVLATPVLSDGTVVRHLKDLSFIGVRYWNDQKLVNRDLLQAAKASLAAMKPQFDLGTNYVKNTPTVLISADTPFCAEEVPVTELAEELRGIAHPDFDVSVHLIGGSLCRLWRQAFTEHRHFTVAAGAAAGGDGGYPFTMNIITIGEGDHQGSPHPGTVRIRAIRRLSDDRWHEDELVHGQVAPQSHHGRGNEIAFKSLKQQLEQTLRDRQDNCVVVTGFPGAGKKSFADYLIATADFNGYPVIGLRQKPSSWRKEDVEQFFNHLPAVIAARSSGFDRLREGPSPIPLVVIEARALPPGAPGTATRDALFAVIGEFFAKMRASDAAAYVILFVPDVPDRRNDDDDGLTVWRLPRIPDESYPGFLAERSADVPLLEADATSLTGRWAGFTDLLVHEAKDTWDRYRGSAPVSTQTARVLIDQALGSDKARLKADSFLNHYMHGGACQQVLDHIMAEVARASQEGRLVAQFDQESLAAAFAPQHAFVVRRAIRRLLKDGILEQPSLSEYKVAVPFPFLVGAVKISVFISYNTVDTKPQAEAIRLGLLARAKPGVNLRVHFHPEDGLDHTQPWKDKLVERLHASRNLVFVHNGKAGFASDVVAGEIGAWLRYWRLGDAGPRRSAAFWVSFGGDTFPWVPDNKAFPENYLEGIDRLAPPDWTQVDDGFLDYLYDGLIEDVPSERTSAGIGR